MKSANANRWKLDSFGRMAFTLIEMVAVVCILSLLASGSMLLLSGPLRKAEQRGTMAELTELHNWALRRSRRASVLLDIDFTTERVVGTILDAKTSSENAVTVAVRKVIVDGAVFDSGGMTISYEAGGSQSYAMLVSEGKRGGTWFFVCGPSGQVETYEDSEAIEDAIVQWLAKWANAN